MAMPNRRPEKLKLEPAIQRMYGALAEDLSFSRCLEVVANALQTHISAVHFEDYDARKSRVEVIGKVDRDELASLAREYAARWQGQNLWMNRGIEQLMSRGYGNGDEVVSEAELLETPYYQHYLRRVDVRHGLGICLWHDGPGRLSVASFNRAAAVGPFSKETMAFIAAISPHLVNAYVICRRASTLTEANHSLRVAIDRSPIGTAILRLDGCILFANAEAERLLSAQVGIGRGCNGILSFECHASNQQFKEILNQSTADACAMRTRSMLIMRSTRHSPPALVLHLCATPPRMGSIPAARFIAFLCPFIRDASRKLDTLMIQMALALTPAEARVLMELSRHCDLETVAIALNVAPSTVRTHLKHVFAKTGARKQAELLSIVERIVGLAPHNADYSADLPGRSML